MNVPLLLVLLLVFSCCSVLSNEVKQVNRVLLDLGENLGSHVQGRIRSHIEAVTLIEVLTSYDQIDGNTSSSTSREDLTLILALGNSSFYVNSNQKSPAIGHLQPEGFAMISTYLHANTLVIASNGKPLDQSRHKNISFDASQQHYGAIVGAYAALEQIGFGFLHPLAPSIPHRLRFPPYALNVSENPYWPERSFHYHTQHPLELTEVLQGHDIPMFGPQGPHCHQLYRKSEKTDGKEGMGRSSPDGTHYCERWEDMVDDVDAMFEWAAANRLNKVEWLLLGSFRWGDLDHGELRMHRLQILTSLGHSYSLLIGADVPLGNIQQHAWHMVNVRLPFEQQRKQIRDRADWVFHAGFDSLTTESGMSEFTHPECDLMLDLLNEYARYVNYTWGKEAAVKVHCSSSQVCDDYPDPRTGEPINFNFLPTFADPALGVFPHTVQMYGLDDPTAGAYGNRDFQLIEDYMHYEASIGNRSVVFYGETSYWVNVDIDVPLFLPIYGQRRVHDLRRIAHREKRDGSRIAGQMNFDSGWEWGYWINNLVTARGSWNPMYSTSHIKLHDNKHVSNDNSNKKFQDEMKIICTKTPCTNLDTNEIGDDIDDDNNANEQEDLRDWIAFRILLSPIVDLFGSTKMMQRIGQSVMDLLVEVSKVQMDLLIFGKINGTISTSNKMTGIAYLCGTDTWVELPRLFGVHLTQPDKVHMYETDDPEWHKVAPLLQEMEKQFQVLNVKATKLLTTALDLSTESNDNHLECEIPVGGAQFDGISILREINDGLSLLYLRAKQVRLLYESKDPSKVQARQERLTESKNVIEEAAVIVSRREDAYQVPWQRVAAWRENPTVYRYGLLWAVHSLYYWWRDLGVAESEERKSPCYLNRMDASEIAVGWGKYTMEVIRNLIDRYLPFSSAYGGNVMNCFVPPLNEFKFPSSLYETIEIDESSYIEQSLNLGASP